LIEFSEIDKINYIYGPCERIFEEIFNCSTTYDELLLFYRFEQVELKYSDKVPKEVK
jgi:hypothetical protein